MYGPFTLATKYIHYLLTATNGKGHGIHSPFVFDFITEVLNNRNHFYAYDAVEALREKLLLNKQTLTVEDLGAGSAVSHTNTRTIASIARNAAKPKKYGQLLFRMANYYRPRTIVELGTSLGITTCYLAMGNLDASVITLEGSAAIGAKALENFHSVQLINVRLVQGNFDNTLSKVVEALTEVNMVFIDGNHRKEPTLDYFRQLVPYMTRESVIIFDDIHWSPEMEQAWMEIRNHPAVLLSIDLFFVGMIFFNPSFRVKQHFSIRF